MAKQSSVPNTESNRKWADPLIGILFFFCLVAIGLGIALNFRPLYYLCIKWFDIEAQSGLSKSVIKENYNALIDYCSPFFTGALKFPSLAASESGLSHFAEVKVIFNIIYIAGFVSALIVIPVFIYRLRSGNARILRTCSITSVIIPVIFLIFCLIDFDRLFLLFHKLVFNNNDWLFDPDTDPVITILPESFFMVCGIVIASVILLGALLSFVAYRKLRSGAGKPRGASAR